MPVKAPPPAAPAPVYSWTGCYVGAGGGYGLIDQELRHHDGSTFRNEFDAGGRGWFGTVQVGCDYQVSSTWVIGVFADYDFSDIKVRLAHPWWNAFSDDKHRNTWAVGGRIGWLPYQQMLLYLSGGYTQARFGESAVRDHLTGADLGIRLERHQPNGWFIGAGYEYGLQWLPGLFWKTEYRFADYGSDRDFFVNWPSGVRRIESVERHTFIQTIRSELVWRFNFGGSPVVARY